MLDRIRHAPGNTSGERCTCAPIRDEGMFRALLHEGVRLALHDPGKILLAADTETLSRTGCADSLLGKASESLVLEQVPGGFAGTKDGPCDELPALHATDRVFLFISSEMSLALLATGHDDKSPPQECRGAWTVQRSTVLSLAGDIAGKDRLGRFLARLSVNPAADRMSAALMRLGMHYKHSVQVLEKEMFAERGELLTVLEILKAISSKRQTHDILFVFVEQVARFVGTKRCSIVRVWEGNDYAHVIASHDDAAVHDQKIVLEKYPELHLAMDTGKKVVANDVHTDPLTASLSPLFRHAGVDALVVIPIVRRNLQVGTLLLRAARRNRGFSFREISFLEVVAEAAASAIEKAQLLETVQLANARLEHMVITDALTGLYNRRYLQDRIGQEVDRAARYGLPLSCLMLDLDNFKHVNDTRGHLAGDAVLRGTAARMQGCTRRVDLIARYGGEEFVIVLPQTGGSGAVTEAERIRAAIAETPMETLTGPVAVTASIGAAVFDPQRMRTPDDLIDMADGALQKAKQLGKNRVVLADNREGKP